MKFVSLVGVLWLGGVGVLWGETEGVTEREVTGGVGAGIERFFEEWVEAESLEGALIGFCVLDEEGEVMFASPLAGTALCPASALKTLTAGAALGALGDDFRFETRLMGQGGISSEGVITGSLVLRGGGDPTLAEKDLLQLADEVVGMGLKRVEGSLRVDESIFPGEPVSDHWVWGDLGNAYGTGAYGVNVGHNVLRLVFDGGEKEGGVAKWLRSEPDMYEGVRWEMDVFSGPPGSGDRVMVYSAPRQSWIHAVGTVPVKSEGFVVRAALPDPPRYAGAFLRKALEERGVVFDDGLTFSPPEVVLASHESAALPEIVDHMQRVSDNLEAQCLFEMMGARYQEEPAELLQAYWEEMGVKFVGLRLIDGSGLARATMIRPVDLARVNYLARQSAYGETFFKTLPGKGDVRSKRGAMSGVRTEVGFVKRGGKEYTFALMGNGLGRVDFWSLRDELLAEIGR